MFYGHAAVPCYIQTESLTNIDDCCVQVVGDLTRRTHEQYWQMHRHGFWPDASNYLFLNRNDQTIAWLGFDHDSGSGMVNVRQIQGRQQSYNSLPKDWASFLLREFINCMAQSQIYTVGVLPARLSPWWHGNPGIADLNALRGRLITYYDRNPRQIGFKLADKELTKKIAALPLPVKLSEQTKTPYHTLSLVGVGR